MLSIEKCPVCGSDKFSSFIQTSAQMHPSKTHFNFDLCHNCQLVFLNPRVPESELQSYYTSWYLPYRGASAWGKYQPLVEKSQSNLDKKRTKWVHKYHAIHSNTTLLDVGCGKPTFLQKSSELYHCQAVGIDFSDEGWKSEPDNFNNLKLIVGEIADLPKDLHPDVITMWHYLEHDYFPLENLQALRRLSHADTTLIIEVPNFESQSRKKFGKYWAGYHTPRHTSLFSPKNIKTLLKNSGWETVKINTFGTLDPYLLYWMSNMEQKEIHWDQNMETEFVSFVTRKILMSPTLFLQKYLSLGIMSVIARPAIK